MTEDQLLVREENIAKTEAFAVGVELKFGFFSDVRKLELEKMLEEKFIRIANLNYINTDKPN